MELDFNSIETGDVGAFVNALHTNVECNKEPLLIQLLALFGNCIGRSSHFTAAADRHFTNLFAIVVGKSARGRKGQSLNMVKQLFYDAEPEWSTSRIKKGLSSGEGLISHIKDDIQIDVQSGVEINQGEVDKRLLIVESEFSSVLKMTQRDGNILSQVLRDAWDSSPLEILTKNNPIRVKEPFVSVIGHITEAELTRYLNSTEIANGLANRFIFIKAQIDKKLPDPEPIDVELKKYLINHLKTSIAHSKKVGKIDFNAEAKNHWFDLYKSISNDDCSIVGSLTARQESQIRRLAMIIALFNGKSYIDLNSLIFAEKIFEYSINTLKNIYGVSMGDPLTDRILDLVKSSPDGLTKTELHKELSRNYQKGNLDNSLKLLKSQFLLDCKKRQGPTGAPTEIWFYVGNPTQ